METTLKDLKIAENSIHKLIKQGGNLTAKYHYRLSFLLKEINNFDIERDRLAKELREKWEDKIPKKIIGGGKENKNEIPEKAINELNEQLQELAEEKIEIRFIKLDVNELIRKKDESGEPLLKIDADDWMTLSPFLDGEPIFEKIEIENKKTETEAGSNVLEMKQKN